MDPIFYIEIEGVIWKVMPDGSWQRLAPDEHMDPAITLVEDTAQLEQAVQVGEQDSSSSVPAASDIDTPASSTSTSSDDSQDLSSDSAGFVTYISPDLPEVLPEAGFNTQPTSYRAETNSPADGVLNLLSTEARLTVQIDDGGDGYENRFEVPSVTISGDAFEIRDGWTISVTVTDVNGQTVSLTAKVRDERYEIDNVDLSGLAEGPLNVYAIATDALDNSVDATDATIKDTLAELSVDIDGNGDNYLNLAEISQDQTKVTLQLTHVEDGQAVKVVISDSSGNTLDYDGIVSGGQVVLEQLDLSSLSDGQLTVSAVTKDVAGNPASGTDTIIKDTQAAITVGVFGNGDDYLNKEESLSSWAGGTVTHVENGQSVYVTVTDSAGTSIQVETQVINGKWLATGDISSLADGEVTVTAETTDIAGNPAISTDTIIKDTQAAVTVDIDGQGDNFLNQFEVPVSDITGTVDNVEDGQTVFVTITDINGDTVTAQTTVAGGAWSLPDLDLSGLSDGELRVQADTTDIAGNPATNTDTIIKDTQAAVTVGVFGNGDNVINQAESVSSWAGGTVTHVEDGQTVTVSATDINGLTVQTQTTVVDGKWVVNGDVSSLADGELTIKVETVDVAGNPASSITSILKDTQAAITVDIDGKGDNYLNKAEVPVSDITGTVNHVEDGQSVTVTITDIHGATVTTEATVSAGVWSVDDLDLSSLADGELTVLAETTDLAGNPASNTDTILKDTQAGLTVTIDGKGDDFLNAAEAPVSDLSGTVDNVEDGQIVSVTVTDVNGDTVTKGTTVSGGVWSVDDLDLSSLADGELTVLAETTDIAGNPAANTDTIVKDTQAAISVEIVSHGDNYLNKQESESSWAGGTVSNVEDGQTVHITVTDSSGKVVELETTVVDGKWTINGDISSLAEGELTVKADTTDLAGNPATSAASVIKDTLAAVTVDIDGQGDNFLNQFEAPVSDITGTVDNVEDGQTVFVTITDINGDTVTAQTTVSGGAWSLPDLDLSGLSDGELTVQADTTDIAGNPATNTDIIIKDTQATITVNVDSGSDGFLNPSELPATRLSGAATHVEDGQTVTIVVTDSNNVSQSFTAIVNQGIWETTQDLSALADGPLSVTVATSDLAGNPATATDNTVVIDTQVTIDIDTLDGLGIYNFKGGNLTSLQGTTTGAEEGQAVTVTVSDGANSVLLTGQVAADGRWLIENIDISSLNAQATWTMDASVTDLAGNQAIDDMPTLVLPGSVVLEESELGPNGDGTSEAVSEINIQFAEFSIHADQPYLNALTSNGLSASAELSADGQSLNVIRSDGKLILSAVINGAGDGITVTLYAPIDQGIGTDTTQTAIMIEGTQHDADGTTETVLAPVVTYILDSEPVATDDSFDVVEASLSSGNILDNDYDLDKGLVVRFIRHDFDGDNVMQDAAIPVGGSAVFTTAQGVLTIFSDGRWTLEADRNLDNSQEQAVRFSYLAGDSDIDYDIADVVINVHDGAAGSISDDAATATEGKVSDSPQSFDGSIQFIAGSDDPATATFAFDPATLASLNALQLTTGAGNQFIQFTLSSDGRVISGTTAEGEIVLSMTMSGKVVGSDIEGNIQLTLARPINHTSSNDAITLPVIILGEDSDGTTIHAGEFVWTLKDGADPQLTSVSGVNLNEDDLESGDVTGQGSFNLTVGSDAIQSLAFNLADQPELSSGGEPITYTLSADGSLLTAWAGGEEVFTVQLGSFQPEADATVTYDITLKKAIDQLNGDTALPLVVTTIDDDGDSSTLTLPINVNDSQSGGITSGAISVTELPKVEAALDADATVSLTVTANKDPIIKIGLQLSNGDPVLDSNGQPVTHNHEALIWRDNGDGSYDAVLPNGQSVFTVSLPETISVASGTVANVDLNFTLHQPVDHGNSGLEDTQLELNLPVVVTDSDGTEQQADTTVTVFDGKDPVLSVAGSISVDEDGLLGDGTEDGVSSTTPVISVAKGSDDIAEIVPDVDAFNALGYQSGGEAVLLSDKDANGWYIAKTQTSGDEVFRLKLNTDGTTEFVLVSSLDHPTGNGENNLPLNFNVHAVDMDGDTSASVTLTVNVQDAVPESTDSTLELVEGEIFSTNLLSDVRMGADGGELNRFIYNGVEYNFETAGVDYFDVDLVNTENNETYGSFRLYKDGRLDLTTKGSVQTDPTVIDDLTYVVRDNDGDEATNTANLILGDNAGSIRTLNTETLEDTQTGSLHIFVTPGDNDQGERVASIQISEASLQGGTLYLNGQALTAENGYVTLTGDQLSSLPGEVTVFPNGSLTYIPPQNQSNTTTTISLDVSAVISTTNGDKLIDGTLDVSVLPVADAPEWAESTFAYDLVEDDPNVVNVDITANLVDQDGSENLSYKLSGIPDGITLMLNGSVVQEGKAYTQAQLSQMTIRTDANLAGVFTFTVIAIATESGNVFADSSDKTAQITHEVTVNVSPDADVPKLSVQDYKGLEDQAINLNNIITGQLTDKDGSETLSYRMEVQDGWLIEGGTAQEISTGVYMVSADEVAAGQIRLIPKQDISSVMESLSIKVTAIATESSADGLDPINQTAESDTQTITIELKGVVDTPDVTDGGQGHWQFDTGTQVISGTQSFAEDSLIPLDFIISTSDDDQSEVLNLLLTNLPDGFTLVDSAGNPVVLPIANVDPDTGIQYQISSEQLQNTYLKAPQDFSGDIHLDILVVSTEPDGDSDTFNLGVDISVSPVVDEQDGTIFTADGIEDRAASFAVLPVPGQDADGSETLTGYKIDSLPDQLTLFFDGVEIQVPEGGLDISTLDPDATLAELIQSGRMTVRASEDLSGTFTLPVSYQVTDTSPDNASDTDVKWIQAQVDVQFHGRVELDTHLESTTEVLESTDGGPIDLSDSVWFVDADLDGSEYLDYILIKMPPGYNFIVEHPNGATQDAEGNWVIPATGLTSDSVREQAAMLLQQATISSASDTDVVEIIVSARVIDDQDARFIDTSLNIQITGHSGGGTCDPVGPPDDIRDNNEPVHTKEGEPIDLSGLLNPDVASDPDNELSFFIDASSLPEGVTIQGQGVITEYDNQGNVMGYSIPPEGLSTLQVVGLDEDWAGNLVLNVAVIETSGCNGDSVTTNQQVNIVVEPVVDDITLTADATSIQEDVATDINLALILGDSIETGQSIEGEGIPAEGKETVNTLTLTLTLPADCELVADDPGLLAYQGNGVWVISDPARLDEITLVPPAHFSGDITITATANITDEATGVAVTDTADKSATITINVAPVTDLAQLTAEDVVGDEDSYIALSNISASLIDTDGSETLSLSIKGVPDGAVLVLKQGEEFVLLPNNGYDGGTFNGTPTMAWQVQPDQLANIYILPPQDFSGDLPLSLEAMTQEIGTTDVKFTTEDFTVGVNPVGDHAQFFGVPDTLSGSEGDPITVPVNITSTETNSDEFISLTVTVNADSDPTALIGLDRIKVGDLFARFTVNADGSMQATLIVQANQIDSFELYAGDAFGDLNITLTASTVDNNQVLGNPVTDVGPETAEDMVISITPVVDEPVLTVEYPSIIAEADGQIPLGLSLSLINPAGNEEGTLTISGLPDGLTLSAGTRQGSDWIIDQSDVAGLSISGGYSGSSDFELSITPSATLGGDTATGMPQSIQVSLVAPGDNTLTATSEADRFVMDGGTAGIPSTDTVINFDYSADSDAIDLSGILAGLNITDGVAADTVIDFTQSASGIEIQVKPDESQIEQIIVLDNVSRDDLYGGNASGVSEAELLQKMIDDQNLIVNS
ncbi:RTX toxin [Photobacterium sp. CAU 1568]|uniref:RTX toxin n=1 Tax=Photobacterium arenosum TaxID=2774143 RepID=A0ABR9BET7_9GAMM|nr:RTX toxin [Photobacterium arenosum]MBD8511083.1 RTX toxin [Photobacterium arenosum]